MSDDLALDHETVDAQLAEVPGGQEPGDAWLARRRLTFGASEVPALLIALGIDKPTPFTPKYIVDLAGRLFGVKAGTRKPAAAGRAAQMGNDVELELLRRWDCDPLNGWPPATHASEVPREWLPLIDRHCPRLSTTPDAWLRMNGRLVNVQIKTDVHGGKRTYPPWWWVQVQAEMAVTGSASSLLLYGGGWACDWTDEKRETPVAWEVPRDDEAIERIRDAAREGWRRVEAIRAAEREKAERRLSNARGPR